MKRLIWILSLIILIIAAVFFYQYSMRNNEEHNKKMFDVVMTEKMQDLYDQAQDWSKPLQFDIHDRRLHGDYKVLSEFLLQVWSNNIETRNTYLRTLKQNHWDQFLNVQRLEKDKANGFKESDQILENVHKAMDVYQKENEQNKKQALAKAATLQMSEGKKQALLEKLKNNQQVIKEDSLFANELQIIHKADDMLDMLKKYKWQVKDQQILFYEDAQVKKFNALYQSVLKQDAKIEEKKIQNAEAVTSDDDANSANVAQSETPKIEDNHK